MRFKVVEDTDWDSRQQFNEDDCCSFVDIDLVCWLSDIDKQYYLESMGINEILISSGAK